MSFPKSKFPEIMETGIGSSVNLGLGPKDLALFDIFLILAVFTLLYPAIGNTALSHDMLHRNGNGLLDSSPRIEKPDCFPRVPRV